MSRVLRPPLHDFRSEACAITSHQQPTSRSASCDLSGDVGYQFVIWMKRRYRRLVLILFGSLAARTAPKFVRVTGLRCVSAPFCTRRGAFSLGSFRQLDTYGLRRWRADNAASRVIQAWENFYTSRTTTSAVELPKSDWSLGLNRASRTQHQTGTSCYLSAFDSS